MNATVTATFVLIAAFAGGLLTGVLIERRLVTPTEAEASVATVSHRPGSPGDRERIARELGLTAEQEAEIDVILDEQQQRIHEIMKETRPLTRAVVHETRIRIEEVLTPEQRARFEEMRHTSSRPEKPGRDE